MKRNMLKCITTIFLIGVVATSFILSVSADSVVKPLLYSNGYVYNGDASMTTPPMEVVRYSEDLSYEMMTANSVVACPSNMFGQYDNYVRFNSNITLGYSAIDLPHAIVHFDFGTFDTAAFNNIEFNVGMFVDPQEPGDPIYDIIIAVNGDINYLDKTVIATQTSYRQYEFDTPEGVTGRYAYATYNLQVILNDVYEAGRYNIYIECNTFMPPFSRDMTYYIGCDDLTCNYMAQEEITTAIKNSVISMSNTTSEINQKTTIISDDVGEIKDILSTTLTEEQMEKIEEGKEFIEDSKIQIKDSAEADEEIRRVVAETFDRYNDIEYDLFGDRYIDHIENYVEPVYNNEGFRSFWDGLWSHSFIIAMCVTVVTFCAIGFALYGVR